MQNPWRCLAAYEEPRFGDKETYKFCGRDKESYELASLIKNNLLVTLYGRTGIGKTSLLEAGVFPLLRRDNYIPIVVRFGLMGDDEKSFAELVVKSIEEQKNLEIKETKEGTISPVTDGKPNVEYLWEYFATRHFYDGGREAFPVIVLDQFEENLIANRHKTELLLIQLYALMDDNKIFPEGYHSETNFRFVLSIREDELFRLEECIDRYLLLDFKRNRYRLTHLSKEGAEKVICIPGQSLLPENETEKRVIVEKIINQATDEDSDNINTLLLSLVCSCLYERCVARKADEITVSDINALGDNLLADFYKSLHIKKHVREVIENKFIDARGRRNVVNIGDLDIPQSELKELCEGNKRILQMTNKRMELVHDLLAHAIFETKRKKDKKNVGLLFKACSLGLFLIVFIIGLLGSVYSVFDSNREGRTPIFPRKDTLVARSWSSIINNEHYIESITYEGGNYVSIENCSRLERVVFQGNQDWIYIEDCPSLRYLEFPDSSSVGKIRLRRCPNLRSLNIPDKVGNISSDIKINVIPNPNSTRYIKKDGIVWDIEQPGIIYANLSTSDIGQTESKYVVFPRQLRDSNSVFYWNFGNRVNFYNQGETTIDGLIIDRDSPKTVIGHANDIKSVDLSGLTLRDGAFENCNTLETVKIDSKTSLGEHVFTNCPNLEEIIIYQSPSFGIYKIRALLNSIRTVPHPLRYSLIGKGPLKKNSEGIITFNDIPVLISKESSKEYEYRICGDTAYVCTKGWLSSLNKSKSNNTTITWWDDLSWGQPQRTAFLEVLHSFGVDTALYVRRRNNLIETATEIFLDDSFNKGTVDPRFRMLTPTKYAKAVFCRNLTQKERTFYVTTNNLRFVDLADSVKSKIQIVVPYGQLDRYLHNTEFDGFKDLNELSLMETIWGTAMYSIKSGLAYLASDLFSLLLFVFGIIITLAFLSYLAFKKLEYQQETTFVWIRAFASSLSITGVAFFVWMSVYWFLWFWVFSPNNIPPAIIASVIAALMIWLMYKNILYQVKNVTLRGVWLEMRLFFTKHWRGILYSILTMLLLLVGLFGLRWRYNRIDRAKRLYETARSVGMWNEDAAKAALFVLTDNLQKGHIPSSSIKDSIYALLPDLYIKVGYNIERLDNSIKSHTISLSADGKLLLSGCNDGRVQVWDLQNRKLLNSIDCRPGSDIKHCDWIDDTTFVASDGTYLCHCHIADTVPTWHSDIKKHRGIKILANKLYYIPNLYGWRSDTIINVVNIHDAKFGDMDTLDIFTNEEIIGLCRHKDKLLVYGGHTLKEYNPETRMSVELLHTPSYIKSVSHCNDANKITVVTSDSIYDIEVINEKVRTTRSSRPEDLDGLITTHNNIRIGYDGSELFEVRDSLETVSTSNRDYIAKEISVWSGAIVSNDNKYVYAINSNDELCIIHTNKPEREEFLQIISQKFIRDNYQLSDGEKLKYGMTE